MLAWLLCGCAAVLLLLVRRRWSKDKEFNQIPGPPANPLLGNLSELGSTEQDAFEAFHRLRSYGDGMYRMYLGGAYLIVYRADVAEDVFNNQNSLLSKGSDYRFLWPWLGTGLVTSTGNKWRSRRKLLTPAFHFNILQSFQKVINKQTKIMIDKLDDFVITGEEFDIHPKLKLCTLDITMESSMAWEVRAQEDSESAYVRAVARIARINEGRFNSLWKRSDFLFNLSHEATVFHKSLKIVHAASDAAIRRRRESFDLCGVPTAEGKKQLALLDLLLSEAARTGSVLSNADLREEVDTILFAGHDTSAAAGAFAIFFLAHSPEVQARLHEEVGAVMGGEEEVTTQHLAQMRYLDAVVKEALRLAPPVPFIIREATENVFIGGYEVPKGTSVALNIFSIHRDPAQFPEPDGFEPERFLTGEQRHPYAFVPFSAGPRNCIGQRFAMMVVKTVVCQLVRRYTISCQQRWEDLGVRQSLTLDPAGGVRITLLKR